MGVLFEKGDFFFPAVETDGGFEVFGEVFGFGVGHEEFERGETDFSFAEACVAVDS